MPHSYLAKKIEKALIKNFPCLILDEQEFQTYFQKLCFKTIVVGHNDVIDVLNDPTLIESSGIEGTGRFMYIRAYNKDGIEERLDMYGNAQILSNGEVVYEYDANILSPGDGIRNLANFYMNYDHVELVDPPKPFKRRATLKSKIDLRINFRNLNNRDKSYYLSDFNSFIVHLENNYFYTHEEKFELLKIFIEKFKVDSFTNDPGSKILREYLSKFKSYSPKFNIFPDPVRKILKDKFDLSIPIWLKLELNYKRYIPKMKSKQLLIYGFNNLNKFLKPNEKIKINTNYNDPSIVPSVLSEYSHTSSSNTYVYKIKDSLKISEIIDYKVLKDFFPTLKNEKIELPKIQMLDPSRILLKKKNEIYDLDIDVILKSTRKMTLSMLNTMSKFSREEYEKIEEKSYRLLSEYTFYKQKKYKNTFFQVSSNKLDCILELMHQFDGKIEQIIIDELFLSFLNFRDYIFKNPLKGSSRQYEMHELPEHMKIEIEKIFLKNFHRGKKVDATFILSEIQYYIRNEYSYLKQKHGDNYYYFLLGYFEPNALLFGDNNDRVQNMQTYLYTSTRYQNSLEKNEIGKNSLEWIFNFITLFNKFAPLLKTLPANNLESLAESDLNRIFYDALSFYTGSSDTEFMWMKPSKRKNYQSLIFNIWVSNEDPSNEFSNDWESCKYFIDDAESTDMLRFAVFHYLYTDIKNMFTFSTHSENTAMMKF